jgi:aspartate kinase
LGADFCDIFTDVDGVYTSDPNVVPDARRIPHLTHEEMLEMASLGAKVLAERSVEYAMRYNVSVRVLHAFQQGAGTLVDGREDEMEQRTVTAVACQRDQAKIAFRGVPDRPGIAASIFAPLSEAGVVVDMIVQNLSEHGLTDLTFTMPRVDLKRLLPVIEDVAQGVRARQVDHDSTIAKVSVVGVGMRTHAGVAARMFQALSEVGVNMQMISTSEIKISCVIEDKFSELAVRVLHDAFELGKQVPAPKRSTAASRAKRPGKRSRT